MKLYKSKEIWKNKIKNRCILNHLKVADKTCETIEKKTGEIGEIVLI